MRTHGLKTQPKDFIEIHNEWVRKQVPKEKLLEMDLADGWEPLRKFLGKPVPSEPFPRANDRDSRDRFMKEKLIQAGVTWVGIMSTAAAVGYGAWRVWRR
jgi:hypothetical protein